MKINKDTAINLVATGIAILVAYFSQIYTSEIKLFMQKIDTVKVFYVICYLVSAYFLLKALISYKKDNKTNDLLLKIGCRGKDDLVAQKIAEKDLTISELREICKNDENRFLGLFLAGACIYFLDYYLNKEKHAISSKSKRTKKQQK